MNAHCKTHTGAIQVTEKAHGFRLFFINRVLFLYLKKMHTDQQTNKRV